MLTPAERATVKAALFDLLNQQDDQRSFLANAVFGTDAQRIPGELPLLTTPADYAEATLTVCLRYGRTPPLLELLLGRLVIGDGTLQPLLDRVRTGVDPNPDAYTDTWLDTRRPFFDRSDLRRRLRALVTESASPILRVVAPADAFGRTYSRTFIDHVAARTGGVTQALGTFLSPGTGPSYAAVDLALDVLTPFGVVEADLPPRASSSYPRAISRFVIGQLMVRPSRWIVVLDGFGQPDLNPEVRETIEAIAFTIPNGVFRDRVRLVLLDYPAPLPGVSPADILEETLAPASQIADTDLVPVVTAIGRRREAEGRAGIDPAGIPQVAAQLVAQAPAAGRARLEALHQSLLDLWSFEGPTP
jgi:hypothetical protein